MQCYDQIKTFDLQCNSMLKSKHMARTRRLLFDLFDKVEFETNIRGHHFYQSDWTPIMEEKLTCNKDDTEEAKEQMKMR